MAIQNDKRLIEDYLPIQAISAEASREKSVRKGHISTLHLWWARRPLVACRAAVYGALVPASQFVPENGPDNKKQSLGRANAARFVTELCKYPGSPRIIGQAQEHILDAHSERLTAELAEAAKTAQWPAWVDEFKWPKGDKQVTRHDIEKGRAPRPRVLDMFAGGGAIPLEALRLGCEAYALDLNPVAHIIELCTLVYPQKYGKPDPTVPGMTGPPLAGAKRSRDREGAVQRSWGGLAEEVRYWGNWVLERVRREIGDLYPPIPDPAVWDTPPETAFDHKTGRWHVTRPGKPKRGARREQLSPAHGRQATMYGDHDSDDEEATSCAGVALPPGFLQPVAYLWTRTVRCKNPACGATVPLVRQTWLCKKARRYVALAMHAPRGAKRVTFEVVESDTEKGLGFDPSAFSKGGNATCPFCGTVADSGYVKAQGRAKRMGEQMMAIVCTRPGRQGKVYRSADDYPQFRPDEEAIRKRIEALCRRTGMTVPSEPIITDAKNSCWTHLYGLSTFGELFTPRQMLCLLTFAAAVREAQAALEQGGVDTERAKAAGTALASIVDRLADFNSTGCTWNYTGGRGVLHAMARQAIPMTWDCAETDPFNPDAASWVSGVKDVPVALETLREVTRPAVLHRASATQLPLINESIDVVVTDPPYYDNVPYADISDFFYVWLKRTIGHLYPEHFATEGTPKKQEAVADAVRHGGSKEKARAAYEQMMAQSFAEANRVLKPGGSMVVVYAHKTTLGWSTLVDALRQAGFTVTEAWPLDTERPGRLREHASAALASSIFLVARKRGGAERGSYEDDVRPELEKIVRERVATLWDQGIAGADLVIACVGAGLRAFTKYERVEYANGEPVPADRFLAEVEAVVLDSMLEQIAGKVARGVTAVDPASRFYVLWRYVYKAAAIEAGEAIVFTYGQHVELDGPKGLASGRNPLVEKKKSTYRLRDFTERGKDEKLGLPPDSGQPGETAPLIDALHRVLWIMENRPRLMTEFLRESRVNRDQLRVLAQALSGPALKGGELGEVSGGEELAALTKLTANWKSVIEDALMPLERNR